MIEEVEEIGALAMRLVQKNVLITSGLLEVQVANNSNSNKDFFVSAD